MRYFDRRVRCTVGTLEVSALSIVFKVTKSLKPEPNTCEVKIYNLSAEHRGQIATAKKLPLRLEAGYADGMATIFLGEVRTMQSVFDNTETITTLSTGDSEKEVQKNRLNVPIGAGASPDYVMGQLAQALGVSPGNVAAAQSKLRAKGYADVYGKRAVISGHVSQEMSDLCKSAGLEWSIQDGRMQILDLNQPLDGQAFELSSDTGMVGSPTVDQKGFVEVKSFLNPLMNPGKKVSLEAENIKGGYRIIHVEYSGDTHGNEWYSTINCQKY